MPWMSLRVSEAVFDWYAATVRTDAPGLLESVAPLLVDGARVEHVGRGLHGYTESAEVHGPDGVVARVLWGGANGWPHVWASGACAPVLAESLRALYPTAHTVSRADSALDVVAVDDSVGDAWDVLLAECLAAAEAHRVKLGTAGDWVTARRPDDAGRTLYVGAKSSPVMVRLYEKGKQLRARADGAAAGAVPDGLVRLELQARPDKAARWRAASLGPEQLWGLGQWTSDLYARVTGGAVERVPAREWNASDDVRALTYLARQYGPTMGRLAARLGGWDRAGVYLGRLVESGWTGELVCEVCGQALHPVVVQEGGRTCPACGWAIRQPPHTPPDAAR